MLLRCHDFAKLVNCFFEWRRVRAVGHVNDLVENWVVFYLDVLMHLLVIVELHFAALLERKQPLLFLFKLLEFVADLLVIDVVEESSKDE